MAKKTSGSKKTKAKRIHSTWDSIYSPDQKNTLTRERIVEGAIALANEKGISAVSIRNVAERIGSSRMALYHYVSSKQDIFNLMLDVAHGNLEWEPEETATWRDALTHLAHEMRDHLRRYPWMAAIRATNPEHGPEWIRALERVLATLDGFGFDVISASRVILGVYVLVTGFVSAEVMQALPKLVLETGEFPHLNRLLKNEDKVRGNEPFESALKWFLDGVAANLILDVQPQKSTERTTRNTSKGKLTFHA